MINKLLSSIPKIEDPILKIKTENLLRLKYEEAGMFVKADELASKILSNIRKIEGIDTTEMISIIKNCYFMRAKRHFDDFIIAMEWNREPKAKFYLPRKKILEGKHGIISKIDDFISSEKSLYLGFSMPPGCGKSTIIKFLLAYIAGRYPLSMNMYVSYSDGMVKMMYDSAKAMMMSDEYCFKEIFPELEEPELSGEYSTVSFRQKGDAPTLGLISLSGSVTGRTRANKFLITDDLVKNAELARSPERLEKLYSDYKSVLTTRMIGDNVKQIMLGTIWCSGDPISRMIKDHKDDDRYQFITIPVWDINEESNFNYDHPDGYSKERIKIIKSDLDPVDFSCLYLQKPMDKEGIAFPYDKLEYYNGTLPDGEPDNIFFVVDVAWGGSDSLSMPICYQYGESYYIHDVLFNRGDQHITKPLVRGKILRHKCKMGQFEANNGGDEYARDITKLLKEDGYYINITHKKAGSGNSKIARVEQYAPLIRHFYFLDENSRDDNYKKFMNEFTSFTFTGENVHDDAVDSLAMLAGYITNRKTGKVFIMNRRELGI